MPTASQSKRANSAPVKGVRPSALAGVKDPTGRVDWLAARLIEREVGRRQNPILAAIYQEFAGDIETALSRVLGPRNPHMRALRKIVQTGARAERAARGGGGALSPKTTGKRGRK